MSESTTARAFRENLRRIRDDEGVTQVELSRRLTLDGWPTLAHQTTLTRIESGQRAVRLDEAIALAHALRRTLGDMLGMPSALAAVEALNAATRDATNLHEEIGSAVGRFVMARDVMIGKRRDVAGRVSAGEYQGDVHEAAQEALAGAETALGLTVEGAVQSGRDVVRAWVTEGGVDDA